MRHNQSYDPKVGTYRVSNQVENPYQLFIVINFDIYNKNRYDYVI